MRIRIEVDSQIEEEEIIIRCKRVTNEITKIQQAISDVQAGEQNFMFFQGEKECYFSLDEIIFFESEGGHINAHTREQVYQVKYKLYELEELLPSSFIRVAKSTILNTNHIHSITKNLTGASEVEFTGTHKHIYVSRGYYKALKEKLDDRRYIR